MRNASEQPQKIRPVTRATFEVPTDLLYEFRALAKLNERTFSSEVRSLMRDYVERHKEQLAA